MRTFRGAYVDDDDKSRQIPEPRDVPHWGLPAALVMIVLSWFTVYGIYCFVRALIG